MARGMLISLAQTSERVSQHKSGRSFLGGHFFCSSTEREARQFECCDVPPDARPKLQAPTPRGKETRPSQTADPQPRRLNLNLRIKLRFPVISCGCAMPGSGS